MRARMVVRASRSWISSEHLDDGEWHAQLIDGRELVASGEGGTLLRPARRCFAAWG